MDFAVKSKRIFLFEKKRDKKTNCLKKRGGVLPLLL